MATLHSIRKKQQSLQIFWDIFDQGTKEEEDQFDPPPADWPIAHVAKALNTRRGSWWWSCGYRLELPRDILILISSFIRPNRQEFLYHHLKELLFFLEKHERSIVLQRLILED